MAQDSESRAQEEIRLKEDKEAKKEERNWWKMGMAPQGPLDNTEWCRMLRQSLPEEQIPSQTCIARRYMGPGPVQHTPSRRNRWLRAQIQEAEILQERLEWRIRGVQQTSQELEKINKRIWRELHYTKDQRGDYSAWYKYHRQQEERWGESSPRILKPENSKRWRTHP
uniref:Rev protein n=1 Tax=Equine infectious anemia virus TaxID=11665 RepID=A0A5J6SBX6_9RETR|nr:rev protein [Equine infectious anemia virus]